MQRCLVLAQLGEGYTAPNPMVGAVIVRENTILAEGWHPAFGEAHAEVVAIDQVKDQALLKDATLYVNLEPCSHFGKTPPCSLKIIESEIPKVVVAAADPNPLVAGQGIQMLKNRGVSVTTGILEEEAKQLNRKFYTFHTKKRPFISLKWAETADGFIGKDRYSNARERLISSDASKYFTHRLRASHQAILSGRKTIQTDDPQLTLRHWHGRHPLRVILDPNHWITPDYTVLNDGLPSTVFTQHHQEEKGNLSFQAIGAPFDLRKILNRLYDSQIQSVLIEGGSSTLQSFIDSNLWDEAWVIKSQHHYWGEGIPAPRLQAKWINNQQLAGDLISHYLPL